ncbi:hypothetical protein [Halobaculum limi]|uniref:hypothetical protein n=1 Tax=Halobaculum limi TaxID=3031916 RepID=UPI002404A8D5|nr:hypothetical protein [Halobaculum sp. YSMS11]
MIASTTVGGLIDEPSRRVDYFEVTSKGLDERFHLAEPATANTVINHNVIEDISSAETICRKPSRSTETGVAWRSGRTSSSSRSVSIPSNW